MPPIPVPGSRTHAATQDPRTVESARTGSASTTQSPAVTWINGQFGAAGFGFSLRAACISGVPVFRTFGVFMSQTAPASPIAFLADEIAETSSLTRQLARAAGEAISRLSGELDNPEARAAIDSLVTALQVQDRVEQRLARLKAYAHRIDDGTNEDAALEGALHLDELVEVFRRHRLASDTATFMGDDEIELF